MVEFMGLTLIFAGLVFFLAGSIGLIRLPDLYSRLHALAKADNVGLVLLALGVVLLEPSLTQSIKVVLIWILVLAASAISSHLIACHALRSEQIDE